MEFGIWNLFVVSRRIRIILFLIVIDPLHILADVVFDGFGHVAFFAGVGAVPLFEGYAFDKARVLTAGAAGLAFGLFFGFFTTGRGVLEIALTDAGAFGPGRLDVGAGYLSGLAGHAEQ